MNKVLPIGSLDLNETKLDSAPICMVLLSAYNGEQFISDQIKSIINQDGVKTYITVRDDGSKDKTLDIILSLQKEYPARINVIKGNNKGIHASFLELMQCIHNDESDYVAFSDQDDIWDHDKLIIAISSLEKEDASFYSCASRLVDERGSEIGTTTSNIGKYSFYMLGNSKILTPGAQGCTMVVRNNLFHQVIRRGVPAEYGHDTWIPVIAYCLGESIYDPNPHMSYRQHNNSWTGNRKNRMKQLIKEARQYFVGLSRYKPLAKDVLEKFSDSLSQEDREVISCIASDDLGFINRIQHLEKLKFGKYGWKENFIFKFYYILGFIK